MSLVALRQPAEWYTLTSSIYLRQPGEWSRSQNRIYLRQLERLRCQSRADNLYLPYHAYLRNIDKLRVLTSR